VVRDCFRNLPAAIDPRQFVLHDNTDGSQPLRVLTDYHDELVHNWVWARSFAKGDSRLIPEQLAYYRLKNQPDAPINRYVYECSNGCALGSSREEAILYGLFEVIERDAYLTTWYGRIPPVPLDLSTALDPQIRLLHCQASALGYELYVFDITMESKVPAVWALLVNPATDAPVKSYSAAGAHLDPEKAVISALVEVMTSMMVYEESLPAYQQKAASMLADVSLVRDMADHVLLYAQAETLDWLSFLFTETAAVSLQRRFADFYQQPAEQNLTALLQQVIARCVAAYGDVLVVDQSFAALAPLDLHAVKVLVPNTHTITFGHQYQRVSLARVNQARIARKLASYADRQALNVHVPHNFP
jgi:ribosomal protein S12 methylthiotransferase accessory factor